MSDYALSWVEVSEIAHEIASQPECWSRAAQLAASFDRALRSPGARVAVVGCGTSLFVGQAYAALREEAGLGDTDAFAASEYPARRRYDVVLAISRSGTTTEVVRVLEGLPSGTWSLAVSAVADSPVARAAAGVAILEFADERSVVQTRFATTALVLLRAQLGWEPDRAIADAEGALAEELPVDPVGFDHFVFLGRGWTVGLANEGALKIRETAGAWAEAYPAMEFRHGPISVAGARSAVWALGPIDADVLRDAAETGATVLARDLDPIAELVAIQGTAVALAEAKGLDPDHPRHLTRSVVLK